MTQPLLEELVQRLEQAQAALPDAWLAHRDGVPRELIESISATVSKGKTFLAAANERAQSVDTPEQRSAADLLLQAFAKGEITDKVDWDDLGLAFEAAKNELPGRYGELVAELGSEGDHDHDA